MVTQAERTAQAREDILLAALKLFARNGFKGTNIRQISAASGRSMGCIYHHFSSKEEIFADLITSNEILPGMAKVGTLVFEADFPDNLREIGAEIRETIAKQREPILLWYVDALEFGGKHARKIIGQAWPVLETAIRAAMQSSGKKINDELDPTLAVRIIVSAFMGIFMQQEIFGVRFTDEVSDKALIDEASRLFLGGIKPR